MLLTVRNIHPIGKVKDFICKVEFEIRGSCHYLVTAYFSRLKIYPRISVVTLVMFEFNISIYYVIKTDIPDESDVELYQLVKRLQTHSHSKY